MGWPERLSGIKPSNLGRTESKKANIHFTIGLKEGRALSLTGKYITYSEAIPKVAEVQEIEL